MALPQSNESKRRRRNGKQCRPWSVYTVCTGLFVRKLRIITVQLVSITRPPIPLLHSKNQYCIMKKRDLKFIQIIQFSFSIANCRNQTMLFRDLIIYLLPSSIILSGNTNSFWNLFWSGKKMPFPPLQQDCYFLPHIIKKKWQQCLNVQWVSYRIALSEFKIMFSKTRNVMFCPPDICYEQEGLSTIYYAATGNMILDFHLSM